MKFKQDPDEQELLDSIEIGEWSTIKNNDAEIERYKNLAKRFFEKSERINIRLSSRDLDLLKLNATKEGLSYYTFVSSILIKYLNGVL